MQNNKIAILIDGGFYVQMFRKNHGSHPKRADVEKTISDILAKVQTKSGPNCNEMLLRTFYYDCLPFAKKIKDPKGKEIDLKLSKVYAAKTTFINSLKTIDQFALRLGEISFSGWKLDPTKKGSVPTLDLRQKGVDMKIGLDMAWMAGKRTIDKLVLVTADSDFISPIKLVRREGILVYLYSMGTTGIKSELQEHSDFII